MAQSVKAIAAAVVAGLIGVALILLAAASIIQIAAQTLNYRAPSGLAMAAALQVLPPTKELSGDMIPRVACIDAPDRKGRIWFSIGTASWIGPRLAMTADHVVAGALSCRVGQASARIAREYRDLDIAFLIADNPTGQYAPISCGGVRPGVDYQTSGYADGEGYRRTAIWEGLDGRVVDTASFFDGMNRFDGLVREGMSGAPIWERDSGRIIAIVNGENEHAPHDVWGRSLADTYLCHGRS